MHVSRSLLLTRCGMQEMDEEKGDEEIGSSTGAGGGMEWWKLGFLDSGGWVMTELVVCVPVPQPGLYGVAEEARVE